MNSTRTVTGEEKELREIAFWDVFFLPFFFSLFFSPILTFTTTAWDECEFFFFLLPRTPIFPSRIHQGSDFFPSRSCVLPEFDTVTDIKTVRELHLHKLNTLFCIRIEESSYLTLWANFTQLRLVFFFTSFYPSFFFQWKQLVQQKNNNNSKRQ